MSYTVKVNFSLKEGRTVVQHHCSDNRVEHNNTAQYHGIGNKNSTQRFGDYIRFFSMLVCTRKQFWDCVSGNRGIFGESEKYSRQRDK